jgi:hypothetical protein
MNQSSRNGTWLLQCHACLMPLEADTGELKYFPAFVLGRAGWKAKIDKRTWVHDDRLMVLTCLSCRLEEIEQQFKLIADELKAAAASESGSVAKRFLDLAEKLVS